MTKTLARKIWRSAAGIRGVPRSEFNFFARRMSYSTTSRRPHVQLVLDFDGTITTADTTAVIGTRCLAKAQELAPVGLPEDRRPRSMAYYSERYFKEYEKWKTSANAKDQDRENIEDEVAYLSQSRHVDVNSFLRVRSAILGVSGGMNDMEGNQSMRDTFMMNEGRDAVCYGDVQIREPDHLRNLIRMVSQWGIVSVNWSRRFILGVLLESGLIEEYQLDHVAKNIRCNELLAPIPLDEQNQPKLICSAKDKLDALNCLLSDWNTRDPHSRIKTVEDQPNLTIYIGDSSTDIGCLTGPVIGMYLTNKNENSDSVLQTFNRFGFECPFISNCSDTTVSADWFRAVSQFQEGKTQRLVYRIKGFQDVEPWLADMTATVDDLSD